MDLWSGLVPRCDPWTLRILAGMLVKSIVEVDAFQSRHSMCIQTYGPRDRRPLFRWTRFRLVMRMAEGGVGTGFCPMMAYWQWTDFKKAIERRLIRQ